MAFQKSAMKHHISLPVPPLANIPLEPIRTGLNVMHPTVHHSVSTPFFVSPFASTIGCSMQ
jgi:hypothetical protein